MATSFVDRNKRTWIITGAAPTMRAVGGYPQSPVLSGGSEEELQTQIDVYAIAHPPLAGTDSNGTMALVGLAFAAAGLLITLKNSHR